MLNEQEIKEELIKYNFFIKITPEKHNCEVSYPGRLFPKKIESFKENYIIEPGAGVKILRSDKKPVFVEMPDYIIRFFIITNIIYNCTKTLKCEASCILCTNEQYNDSGQFYESMNIVFPDMSEDDLKKEIIVTDIWLSSYYSGFNSIDDSYIEVKEGLVVLQKIFKGEFK